MALNFHKDFFTFYSRPVEDKENLNSRINTVLDNFEVKNRLTFLKDNLTLEELEQKIDYRKIGSKLQIKRQECLNFLFQIIDD